MRTNNFRPGLIAGTALLSVAAAPTQPKEGPRPVHMNQLGFMPQGVKRAIVPNQG